MLSFLFLIIIRVSWNPIEDADFYKVFLMRGNEWFEVGTVTDNTVDIIPTYDAFSAISVSTIRDGLESVPSAAYALPDVCTALEVEIFNLRRTCGKKCSKVPRAF